MKISVFSDTVAPYRMAWAEELAKNADVCFFYTKSKGDTLNDNWLVRSSQSVTLIRLPAVVLNDRAVSWEVVHSLMKEETDIIIFDGYGVLPNFLGILYMCLTRQKHYINIDGVYIHRNENILKRWLKRIAFNRYAHYLCGSDYTKRYLIDRGIQENRIVVHHFSSVHEKDILRSPVPLQEKNRLKEKLGFLQIPTILAVGRFLAWKRFDLLIEAFAPMDHYCQLLIIGEGKERSDYENLIVQYDLRNVHIIPFMPYEKLTDYYKASDLFVHPAVTEIWGLVINEAMSFGLPVIGSDDCIGAEALIENGKNGYIIAGGSDAFREKMMEIVDNADLRSRFSKRSLQIIKDYTIEYMARVHMEEFS